MTASKETMAVCSIFEDETSTLIYFDHARELVYSVKGQKEALEGMLESLREAFKSTRSPEKKVSTGIKLGVALWILRGYDEAIEVLDAVREEPVAAYVLGLCLIEKRQYPDAIKALSAAAKKGENAFAAAMALAEAHRLKGDVPAALEIIARHEAQGFFGRRDVTLFCDRGRGQCERKREHACGQRRFSCPDKR
jgi:tetratricopeptide (TPR) repeat protein